MYEAGWVWRLSNPSKYVNVLTSLWGSEADVVICCPVQVKVDILQADDTRSIPQQTGILQGI